MRLGTFLSLLRSGRLGLLPSVAGAVRRFHRLAFLAGGLFAKLAPGPVPLGRLAADLLAAPGLEAWLDRGVGLGALRSRPFPVGVLRHSRAFLRAGGRLLLTSVCGRRGAAAEVLNPESRR